MTTKELQNELRKESLSLSEVKQILFSLKNDVLRKQAEDISESEIHFYGGEGNAFYIALDLLEKVSVPE